MRELAKSLTGTTNIMVDSGAYSNFMAIQKNDKKYIPITIDDYINECRTTYKDVWQYVALDVIMDEPTTMRNLNLMADAGLSPMAVLTPTAPIESAVELLKYNNSNRISVSGGAVGKSEKFVASRIVQTYNITDQKAKIHGLGYMRHPQVFHLPLSTMDASSMNSGARYGSMMIYDERGGIQSAHWKDLSNPKTPRLKRILGHLMRSGIKTKHLANKEYYVGHHSIVNMACVYAYLRYANHATVKDLGLFMSLANITITISLLAILASSTQTKFDYYKARELYFELNDLAKSKGDKTHILCEKAHQIMTTQTLWQHNILDDSKQEEKEEPNVES